MTDNKNLDSLDKRGLYLLPMNNTLYYGDNLPILREYLAAESVDLIYLDPPFNSNRPYNVIFKEETGLESPAQIVAFNDTWHWDDNAEAIYLEIVRDASEHVVKMIGAMLDFVGRNQVMAYLVMMTARLIELRRVLKPTGSIYLHCDPTVGHYLKVVMDTIFGKENFRNEIVWKRTSAHNDPKRYGRNIDLIFFYTKNQSWTWNQQYIPHEQEYLKRFRHQTADGRKWADYDLSAKGLTGGGYQYEYKGITSLWRVPLKTMQKLDEENKLHFTGKGGIRIKRYLDETKGVPLQANWIDIPPINSQARERLGYQTQKPEALLERIILTSSNEGDVVLDPFCGCGTAVVAAQKLNRRWMGIDITHLAIALQKYRLQDSFELIANKDYQIIGEPKDVPSARRLARDNRYQFQWWALSLVQAKPVGEPVSTEEGKRKTGKKGADHGIDGVINFIDEANRKPKRVIVQIKSGKVGVSDIRDLRGVIERDKAPIGVLITLEAPTEPMRQEARTAGVYHSPGWHKDFPVLQILTIEELLTGAVVQKPPDFATFKRAPRIRETPDEQLEL